MKPEQNKLTSKKLNHKDYSKFIEKAKHKKEKSTVKRLLRENSFLRQKLNEQENNFKRIVHDLKGYFATIKPSVEMLKQNSDGELLLEVGELRTYINCLKIAMENSLELLDELLPKNSNKRDKIQLDEFEMDFYKNTGELMPNLNIELEVVNLKKIIDSTVLLYEPIIDKKSIKLDVLFSNSSEDVIFSNYIRLKRVTFNLLSNAIKFANSRVLIEVKVEGDNKENNDNSDLPSKNILISVFNDGKIMDEEIKNSILSTPTNKLYIDKTKLKRQQYELYSSDFYQHTGHGIGLLSVRQMIDELGGSFGINNHLENDYGCEIVVRLPINIED